MLLQGFVVLTFKSTDLTYRPHVSHLLMERSVFFQVSLRWKLLPAPLAGELLIFLIFLCRRLSKWDKLDLQESLGLVHLGSLSSLVLVCITLFVSSHLGCNILDRHQVWYLWLQRWSALGCFKMIWRDQVVLLVMFKLDVSEQALRVGVAIVTVSALKSLSIYKGKGKK